MSFTQRFRNLDDDMDIFHGTSLRTSHVVATQNLLLLNCYYPTRKFDNPRMNEPLCQFVYNKGRRTPFMTMADVTVLINDVERLLGLGRETEVTTRLSIGSVRVSDQQIWFMESGERYRNPEKRRAGDFVRAIIKVLTAFLEKEGEEYPLFSESRFCDGVTQETMLLVTHHGDLSYGQVPSFLRYKQSTNGEGGELTLQYGQLQVHLNEGHARGVQWKHFLSTFSQGLTNVVEKVKDGSKSHTERLFADHPVLGKYNIYISMIREYRGTSIIISSDLSCMNSKVSFVVEGSNLDTLKHFIDAVIIYLEKQND